MSDMAVIEALWIGEVTPDTGSSLIQRFIRRNYSHNGFIFQKTGMLWHATTQADDSGIPDGVCEQVPSVALKGCVIRAKKTIELTITNQYLEGWLEGERGKKYSNRQNWAHMLPFLRGWFKNGDRERNCSEFLAGVCQWSKYKFLDDKDWVLPSDTYRVIRPEPCHEIVDDNFRPIRK